MDFGFIVGISEVMGWIWTKAQARILENLTRFVLLCGGRRAGKSLTTARWMFLQVVRTLMEWEDAGRQRVQGGIIPFWLVGKSYEATEQEYNYLADDLEERFGTDFVHVTRRNIGPNEITIRVSEKPKLDFVVRTKSAQDEGSLEAEAVGAVAVCEAAQISYSAYLRLQGRIAQRRAPILLSGSLEDDFGWYNDLMVDWGHERAWNEEDSRSWVIESETNQFDFPEGANDPELQRLRNSMSEDDFNRMFMGRPAPIRGLVHPTFRNTVHVQNVPYIPGEDVWLAIDPGISGLENRGSAYAVLFCHIVDVQGIHKQYRVFDSIYVGNVDEDVIIETAMNKPWWGKADIYGVIDRAGKNRTNFKEAATSHATWRNLAGLRLRYSKKTILLRDARQRFNAMLRVHGTTGQPGLVMDAERCKGLQSELGGCANPLRPDLSDQVYRWELDSDDMIMGKDPRDRFCDCIKAAYYLGWDREKHVYPRNMQRQSATRRRRTLRTPVRA